VQARPTANFATVFDNSNVSPTKDRALISQHAKSVPCLFLLMYDKSKIDLVLRLITEGESQRNIAKLTGVTKNTIAKWASGLLPNYYGRQETDVHGERIFATSTKLCTKHKCRLPCVACAACRYRERHPQKFNGDCDPPPSLYDEAYRRGCDELRRWMDETDDFVNEGIE
jgi:predicted transcriptional regulator